MLMELASRLVLEGDAFLGMDIDDVGMLGVSDASFAGVWVCFATSNCFDSELLSLWVKEVDAWYEWRDNVECVPFEIDVGSSLFDVCMLR